MTQNRCCLYQNHGHNPRHTQHIINDPWWPWLLKGKGWMNEWKEENVDELDAVKFKECAIEPQSMIYTLICDWFIMATIELSGIWPCKKSRKGWTPARKCPTFFGQYVFISREIRFGSFWTHFTSHRWLWLWLCLCFWLITREFLILSSHLNSVTGHKNCSLG